MSRPAPFYVVVPTDRVPSTGDRIAFDDAGNVVWQQIESRVHDVTIINERTIGRLHQNIRRGWERYMTEVGACAHVGSVRPGVGRREGRRVQIVAGPRPTIIDPWAAVRNNHSFDTERMTIGYSRIQAEAERFPEIRITSPAGGRTETALRLLEEYRRTIVEAIGVPANIIAPSIRDWQTTSQFQVTGPAINSLNQLIRASAESQDSQRYRAGMLAENMVQRTWGSMMDDLESRIARDILNDGSAMVTSARSVEAPIARRTITEWADRERSLIYHGATTGRHRPTQPRQTQRNEIRSVFVSEPGYVLHEGEQLIVHVMGSDKLEAFVSHEGQIIQVGHLRDCSVLVNIQALLDYDITDCWDHFVESMNGPELHIISRRKGYTPEPERPTTIDITPSRRRIII